ncbi:hypothetical protein TWF281_002936 [Arthrobotrys megalospora]
MATANTEVGDVIRLALTADWSKDLRSAPELIHILGICTALTTKKEILALQLHDTRLANKGLTSNLLHLSNHGQASFQQAHSDTYQISIRAHEIGRAGGYVDRIIKNFCDNNPRAKKRLERALRGLEEQAKSSKKEGEITKAKFDEWKNKTDMVQEAVATELGETQLTLVEKEKHEREMEDSFRVIQQDTIVAKSQLDNAVLAAERAQKAASESYQRLYSSLAPENIVLIVGVAGGVALAGGAGLAAGIGLSIFRILLEGFEVSNRWSDVRTAEAALESQSDALGDCVRRLLIVRGGVGDAKSETKRWAEICSVVAIALRELTTLQRHIRIMVQYFSSLSDKIGLLSERCNAGFREIALGGGGDTEGEVDADDLEELMDQARQIKAFALVVNAMARAYAKVSQNELFQGFQLISNISNRNPSLIFDEEHIERSRGELVLYQRAAESGIAKSVYESKLQLFEECKGIYPGLTDDSPLNPANQLPPPYTSRDGSN